MKKALAVCAAAAILARMLTRRTFMGSLVGAVAVSLLGGTAKVVGWNPADQDGIGVGDGLTGRIVDPTTGAGVFNPNLNPAVVGVDPQTGALAPEGTDMSFAAPIRRQIQTNVINGDFSVLPPLGADTPIVSDPSSGAYNPLPGWTWEPDASGLQSATVTADSSFASGYKLVVTGTNASDPGVLSQLIAVPMSQGQQYRVPVSLYTVSTGGGGGFSLVTQFYRADATTAIGSPVTTSVPAGGSTETKYDAGLVPPTAAYLRIAVTFDMAANTGTAIGEVRAALLPAEASVGLSSRTSATSAITTTETRVVAATIPANTFVVGSVYRVTAYGVASNASGANRALTLRIRIGPTTLTGTVIATRAPNILNGAAGEGFKAEFLVTVRSTGASGAIVGRGETLSGANPLNLAAQVSNDAATTINTTVANLIELTAQTGNAGASATFDMAVIECIMAS